MKKIILSALLAIFVIAGVAFSEYFPDVIVTSPNGAWTDTRAYTTIDAAITAIGANVRDLYIVDQEVTTALTIPANAHLRFLGAGSIANTGQLTINTTNITAGDRQIFTGAGDIDWIAGSVVRSTWFSNLDEAFDVTSDDTLTMVISKAETLTADAVVGDNVTLHWESPFIITSTGFNLTGLKKIEAGCYQIFGVSAADDFDFLAGSVVHSSWFVRLRTAITTTSDENVNLTILVDQSETIDTDTTLDAYQLLQVKSGCLITVEAGDTLTINGGIEAGSYHIFTAVATGDFDFAAGSVLKTSWFSTLELADTLTNDDNVALTLIVDQDEAVAGSPTLDIYQALDVNRGRIITVATGQTLTIDGPFLPGSFHVFTGTGTGVVKFGGNACHEIFPEWWNVDGTADEVQIQQAIESVSGLTGATIKLLPKDYNTTSTITVNRDRINILGSGEMATRIVFAPTADDVCMEWDEGATMISQCSIRDLTFYTTDTVWDKDAMRLIDIDIFEMKNVQISGSDTNGWTGGTESIGLRIQGRNIGSIQNVNIKADVPISIEDNPNSTVDIDHFNFNNLYLTSKNDDTLPCVRVANGVNLSNVTFDGVQAWVNGLYGFYWNDTTTIKTSLSLAFNNVRIENTASAAGYMFYIDHKHGLQNLSFNNIYGGVGINGYYLRDTWNVSIKDSYYTNVTALIALNIDVSVRNLTLVNDFWQANTTLTISGQTLLSGNRQVYGPIPSNAVYQDTTRQTRPQFLSEAAYSAPTVTLADGGKARIAGQAYTGLAIISSTSSYSAVYAINGLYGTVTEISNPGAGYTTTEDNDTTTNIYWDVGNVQYEINNEDGVSRDYWVILIGRNR